MLKFSVNRSTEKDIREHLYRTDNDYVPPLHTYLDIDAYAKKLFEKSHRLEYFNGDDLVALVALYINLEGRFIHITNFSIEREHRGIGMTYGLALLGFLEEAKADENEVSAISLIDEHIAEEILAAKEREGVGHLDVDKVTAEVRHESKKVLRLYQNMGFSIYDETDTTYKVVLNIK